MPGMTIQQIADALGIPKSHVRRILSVALHKLRLKYMVRGYKKSDFLDDTDIHEHSEKYRSANLPEPIKEMLNL